MQPPADTLREIVSMTEASASSSEARLVFLNTRDTSAVTKLPVQLSGEGSVALERETDTAGSITLPVGRWTISLPAGQYSVRSPEVSAAARQELVVWVSPVESFRVRTQDATGHPIGMVRVVMEVEDAAAGPIRSQSDDDGIVLFDNVAADGADWLVAWKSGWLPAQHQIGSLPRDGECAVLVLSPDLDEDAFVLECLDDGGGPLEGVAVHMRPQRYGDRDLWLGRSSARGSVEVGALASALPCEFWFSGPVYATRLSIAEAPSSRVLRAHLPRSVLGTIQLAGGPSADRVEVTVVDAGVTASPPANQYVNASARWITSANGQLRTALPRNRKVKVTCRDEAGRSSTQFFTATDDGWQLTMTLDNPMTSHLVTLIPQGGAIGSVSASGRPVEVWRSGAVVTFRADAGFLHIEARGEGGVAGVSLSGQLREDTVLDVQLPALHPILYSVRDLHGEPIRDVEVEFRRTSELSREAVAGTSFKRFWIPNNLRGSVDVLGKGKLELMAGDYEVWLRNLTFRDRAGAWRPMEGAKFASPASAPLMIVTGKPRRVAIRWRIDNADSAIRWRVHGPDDDILGVFHGSTGILWCSNDQHDFQVRSEAGELLGHVLIPEGTGDCTVNAFSLETKR